MFPWLWIFAPQTYWPLSGAVMQDLTPEAFFRGILPGAGVPAIERRIFEEASYGKQLGWIMDVLADSIDPAKLPTEEARQALINLKELQAKGRRIKEQVRRDDGKARS
jgi:hypothetical protein